MTPRLLAALRSVASSTRERPAELDRLSERELEVLELVAKGASNMEMIATQLGVGERTVATNTSPCGLFGDNVSTCVRWASES